MIYFDYSVQKLICELEGLPNTKNESLFFGDKIIYSLQKEYVCYGVEKEGLTYEELKEYYL